METPTATCACDGAGIARIPAAKTNKRIKRAIRIIFTFLAFAGLSRVSVLGGSLPLKTTLYMKHRATLKVAINGSKAYKKNNLEAESRLDFLTPEVRIGYC